MGSVTLVLCIAFRLKYRKINSLPKNLHAKIFNKTFNVFNPYSERRKIIHNFLVAVPFAIFAASLAFITLIWKIFEYGLLLSLTSLIICLNLMLVDVAAETYQNAKIFVEAVKDERILGVGDVKAFQTLKGALPKLGNYYLVLSILFWASALTVGYVWSSLLWILARVIGMIYEFSWLTGDILYWQVTLCLYLLMVVVIQVSVWKIKGKFLSYIFSPPTLEK